MVSTPRIDPDSTPARGLLSDEAAYEVWAWSEEGDLQRNVVEANHHTITDGVVEFWHVVDNVYHFVAAFSDYRSFSPCSSREVSSVTDEQVTEAIKAVGNPFEQITDDEAPADPVERQEWYQKVRDEVQATLAAGRFPEGGGVHHKQLQDIWEGKGDPDPDAYGLVTRAHETLPHEERLEDLEDENRAYWPTGADPDELARWQRERREADERKLAALREQADASRDESVLPSLPAHLNPEVPNPDAGGDPLARQLPVPPYGDTNPVYTTMLLPDGTVPTRTDAFGNPIETPEAVSAYAHKAAATTPTEDWHGKARPF